jgi:hypothetical protein
MAEKGIFRWFSTSHSVLGGEVATPMDHATLAKASIAYAPIGFATIFVVVCLFVSALLVTAGMVDAIGRDHTPDVRNAFAAITSKWWRILLFSVKFLLAVGVVFAGVVVPSFFALKAIHHVELLYSPKLLYAWVIVFVGCIAWLIMPAAIRLLQANSTGLVSSRTRIQATILAILVSEAGMALGMIVQKMEAGTILDSQWEVTALSALNSIVANAPNVLLFIAMALLAAKFKQEPAIEVSREASAVPTEELPE